MSSNLQTLSGEPLEDRGIFLEEGKYYRTRNGLIVCVRWIIKRAGSCSKYYQDHTAFCDRTDLKTGKTVDTSYALNGKWCICKEQLKKTAADYDIVEEIEACAAQELLPPIP